ncbi:MULTISPECIES: mechanosensitive ion channel family protein [Pseudomonas]|uniref:mechanosensitive ion channel family protein n=1 Tax=Pseudomonas TaxID=286 RepID=UPI000CF4549A|nr:MULTISPECIES: mechanosensitive ion channel family protein [Pseudomonas]MDD2075560.1 mechanosensitive ion channel family protein [Pseudomonas putida]HDS1690685.1 mechanosensitive ion channel family protein [Pseudomonas putida]
MGMKRRLGRAAWLMLLIHVLFSPLLHAAPPQAGPEIEGVIAEPAPLTVINRTVLVFRATLLGETPKVRAQRAKKVIEETLQETNDLEVRVDPILRSYLVLLGGRRAFIVTPLDAAADSITAGEAAEQAAENLRLVVEETRQARSLRFLLTAIGYSAAATLVFFMLVKAAGYCRRKLLGLLPKLMGKHSERLKVGHTQVFDLQNLYYLIDRSLWLLYWLVVLLFCYQWLGFVLSQFPYTRSWGESLNIHLMELLNYLVSGILRAMPGLVVALSIFFIARGISAFSKRVLRRMARPGTLKWLTAETLQPTMRLTSLAIWLFALVMAYPYLPGSGTDAFKGLSVLLGLMISLGATSVIGQGAAGLILTYTRTMRVGEFVRVGDYEGTVTEVGIFTTSIRTGLGEVLTLPNSMITGSVTKNYSRIVEGPGYVVDTVVTIGYDTPWRQVEAMLLEAARRTDGVLQTPAPQVFQTALSDFYPEYRLVAQAIPSEPRPRAQLLSLLHANIQDVFNEYGVQIMSPHYLGDPEQPKWVPKEQWHAAPSKPENSA